MTFFNSIKMCYMKSFDFKGRASKSEYWWFWLFQLVLCVIVCYSAVLNKVLIYVLIGVMIASIPANLSSMVRRFHDAGLSTKQLLMKLSYAVAPFLFAVNFATVIDPFSSFAVVLLIALLLFSAVSFFLLFIILIGDSVYEDEEEE